MSRVVVVGGGLGGAACAVRLAHAGHAVTLLEKNEALGGKMSVLRHKGFLFDTGPTILTMPQVLDRLFESVGRRRENYLDLVPLEPQWRAFFEDGAAVDVWGDAARMEEEIRRFAPGDAAGHARFREYGRRMHEIAERFFFWRSVGGLRDLLKTDELFDAEGLRLVRDMDFFSTVSQAVDRHFQDPRLRQIYEHFMQYVGSSPRLAPAILSCIHHIQGAFGVWYPRGGMNRVAAALETLAEEFRVDMRFGRRVERIVARGSRVEGVEANGEFLPADAVVANADFVRAHRELLPSGGDSGKTEPSCSGVVFYFGLNRRYDVLRHHDFFFSRDSRREFDDIYRRKIPAQDPTLCVCAPSRTDPSVAPEGCENVYVLVHTPHLQGAEDWEKLRLPYRDLVVAKLERCGLTDFGKHVTAEHVMTPSDLDSRYLVDRGAIYGRASHGRFTGGFKPANRSSRYENLYFCGGSVNPGPGVPMALMSGQIAADCALADLPVPSSLVPR
ncbi:MAG: phytoene desaturase family protein [Elusimicrobiota bacterium]